GGWARLKEQLTHPSARPASPVVEPSWFRPWLRPGHRLSMAVMPALIVTASVLWAMNGSSGILLGEVPAAGTVSTRIEAATDAARAIAAATPPSELARRQSPGRRTSRTLLQLGVLDSIDPARPTPHVAPAAALDSMTGAVLPRDLLPGEDRDQM